MNRARLETNQELKIFIKANDDVRDCLLSRRDGGRKLSEGLKELVHEKYEGRFRLAILTESAPTISEVLAQVEFAPPDQGTTRLVSERPDIILLSLEADVSWKEDGEVLDRERLLQDLVAVINLLRERVGAHLLCFNVPTFDPGDTTANYAAAFYGTPSLRAHGADLALLEASLQEGISIVDVDRLLAELGAARHLGQMFDYSPEACEAVCAEVLRILEDYGFFEDRPIVMQVGQVEGATDDR
jgi:hypothetical protein